MRPLNIGLSISLLIVSIWWHYFHKYQFCSKNFVESAKTQGYIAEKHDVYTEDGYILTIFRISKGKNCKEEIKSIPILLMHGIFESSDIFLDAGPNAGLAYLFPDACYDLWIGNIRGNSYSRKHQFLDADSEAFWNFTADEISFHDIPAKIDYILNHSKSPKVNVVGFSQGGSIPLLMCSQRPEYCDKINVIISISPPTKLNHSRTNLFWSMVKFVTIFEDLFYLCGVYELFPKHGVIQKTAELICSSELNTVNRYICQTILSLIDSHTPGSISDETLRNIFKHFPDGISIKNLARYGQIFQSGTVQKYNYGTLNIEKYGSADPPAYDFKGIRTPILIIHGKNDHLVDYRDSEEFAKELINAELYVIEEPFWNHFDMIYSQHTNKTIFYKINDYLINKTK